MDIKGAGDTLAVNVAAQNPRGTNESVAAEERVAADSSVERKEAEETSAPASTPPQGLGREIDVQA